MENKEIDKQINLSRQYAFDFMKKCKRKGIIPQFCFLGSLTELLTMSLCTCPEEKYIHEAIEQAWKLAREKHEENHKDQ